MEGTKNWYNKQYEAWVPWIEDKVLGWWGENKTSYVAKGTLSVSGVFRVFRFLRLTDLRL